MLRGLLKFLLGTIVLLALLGSWFVLSLRAVLPETVFDLAPLAAGDSQAPPVLIFGASRGTGLQIARQLRARGDRVTAFVRPSSDRSGLEPLGVQYVVGDALEMPAVSAAFAAGPYRAVVSTIGCFKCEQPPDYIANRNIVAAARKAGVQRMVLVTSIGVGDSADAIPWASKKFLGSILPLKEQAELTLIDSGLDYTIIRPGGLVRDGDTPTGHGVLTEDRHAFGFISRADLAQLIIRCLDDDHTIGRIFAALDPRRRFLWSRPSDDQKQ